MQAYVKEHANLRPYFRELWGFCQVNDFPMAVVSQGLDFYIQALLDKEGLGRVPIYAVNPKFQNGESSYTYEHNYPGKMTEGNSKGFVVKSFQQLGCHVFFAGDGRSDLEAAQVADTVFAHSTLAKFCDDEDIPYNHFQDFGAMLVSVQQFSKNGQSVDGVA